MHRVFGCGTEVSVPTADLALLIQKFMSGFILVPDFFERAHGAMPDDVLIAIVSACSRLA